MNYLIQVALRMARVGVIITAVAFVSGCSGSSDSGSAGSTSGNCAPSDPSTAAECGNVLVAVTDADGDFVSYTVDVLSVTLERAGGGSIETLPAAARIDFSELTDRAELLSTATLAPGDIAGGSIRLDYSNAEIYVESNGDIVPAQAVDENGSPLGIVDIEIRLADREHLLIARGRTALLSIDFDLAASHEIALTAVPARVMTRPYLVAEVRPLTEKEFRVRGALADVDLANSSYDIRLRPWHRRDGDFGAMTVRTTPTTEFEIGDVVLTGQSGLVALDGLDRGTLTVAFGALDLQQRQFTASIVHAGDSVGGDRLAAIHGNVVARNGDTLTVKGALAVYRDRPARFRRAVIVEVGPDTRVGKVGDRLSTLGKDDISVGQRIVAFGQFTNLPAADPAAPDIALVLDATQGRVRMLVTHLHGTVNSILPGQVNLTLRAIDRLGVDMYDFTGTGAPDADPSDYEVDTATLSLERLEVGKWARVYGFVTPFGAAPPDFVGRTVVDHRDIPAVLGIAWGIAGTARPFSSMEPQALVLDMTNGAIGTRHHLLLGRRLIDLYDLPMPPTIAAVDLPGLYGISEPGHIELFTDFSAFVDALLLRLGGGSKAQALAASGAFDEAASTVGARRVFVHMTTAAP